MITIFPFKCSKCKVDFNCDEGGKCNKCGKLFCNNHLYKIKTGEEAIFLCGEDKGEKVGTIIKNDVLKFRENSKLGS